MPDTHYCPTFWALYDDLCEQVEAGTLDEYGVAYRLKDHRLGCRECTSVQDNRRRMSISLYQGANSHESIESVNQQFTERQEK